MRLGTKGEVTVAIALGLAAVGLLIGTVMPNLNPFNRMFGSHGTQSAAKQTATWTRQDEVITPKVVSLKDGQAVVVNQFERHYDTGTEETTPKLTIGQRIGNFIARLSTWGLIFIIVSLVFFGGGPIVWAFRKYTSVKDALKNTVAAIREADEETFSKLKPKLAEKHNKADKIIVDKIKSELH